MATLTWYGHSCFKLDFDGAASVIFDPYAEGSVPGVEIPQGISADEVLCSHDHKDHNAADRVTLTGRIPAYETMVIYTFHDDCGGTKRGTNKIHIVEYNGFRAVHFGDLGCTLTDAQLALLRGADLALVPVGGHFTIDPAQAAELISAVAPRVAVPMHYRRGSMGYEMISALDDFLALADGAVSAGSDTLTVDDAAHGVIYMELP